MKKLMIAAAIVCAAAFVQAGTVSWNIYDVAKGSTPVYQGNAYMFDAATIAIDAVAGDIQRAFADGGNSGLQSWLNEKALGKDGTAVTWTGTLDTEYNVGDYSVPSKSYQNAELGLAGATSYTLYSVIFDSTTANINGNTSFLVTTSKTATTKSDAATQNAGFGIGSQAGGTWTTVAVPEPTTGILMLLGMAGLALRRRRA